MIADEKSYCVVRRKADIASDGNLYELMAADMSQVEADRYIKSGYWNDGDIFIRMDMSCVSNMRDYAENMYVSGEQGKAVYVEFDDSIFGIYEFKTWIRAWEMSDFGGDELIGTAYQKGVPLKHIAKAAYECAIVAADTAGINKGRIAFAMDMLKMWTEDKEVNISSAHQMMVDSCDDYFVDNRNEAYEACLSCLCAIALVATKNDSKAYLTAADAVTNAAMSCSKKYNMEFFADIVRRNIPLHVLLKAIAGV